MPRLREFAELPASSFQLGGGAERLSPLRRRLAHG